MSKPIPTNPSELGRSKIALPTNPPPTLDQVAPPKAGLTDAQKAAFLEESKQKAKK
jgi:hypothetical protein